jgi:hypothetical protein
MIWQFDPIDPERIDPAGWFIMQRTVEAFVPENGLWDESGVPVTIRR